MNLTSLQIIQENTSGLIDLHQARGGGELPVIAAPGDFRVIPIDESTVEFSLNRAERGAIVQDSPRGSRETSPYFLAERAPMNLTVNGIQVVVESAWRDESLLHWLREAQGLAGARFGCGVGLCGACTVLLDGDAVRACMVRVADVGARSVSTVEGLASDTGLLHPVQHAWLETNVPQCGYCQSGQIERTGVLRQGLEIVTGQPLYANDQRDCGSAVCCVHLSRPNWSVR